MKNSKQFIGIAAIGAGVIVLIALLPLLIYAIGWFLA